LHSEWVRVEYLGPLTKAGSQQGNRMMLDLLTQTSAVKVKRKIVPVFN